MKAVSDNTKLIEIDPNYAQPYGNRGAAYEKIGEYEKAQKDHDRYEELRSKR